MFQVRLLSVGLYQGPPWAVGQDREHRGALSGVSVLKAELGVEKELTAGFSPLFQRQQADCD